MLSRKVIAALGLILLSTVCYYLPSYLIDLDEFDFSSVPTRFFTFYIWFVACQLFLITTYAAYLFFLTKISSYKEKILFLWLFVTEGSTFIDHVLRRFLGIGDYSHIQRIVTLLIFSIGCAWILKQILYRDKSDSFDMGKTYFINFLPKDIMGLINFIFRRRGHLGIYQKGYVYRFRKKTGIIEQSKVTSEFISRKDISFKQIKEIDNVERFIGIKFNLFNYNCNRLAHEAQKS